MFIGQAESQALQEIQVEALLFILERLNKLVRPNAAPKGQAYLHQGRSTKREASMVTPRTISQPIATSLDQKLKRAKNGSTFSKTKMSPLIATM